MKEKKNRHSKRHSSRNRNKKKKTPIIIASAVILLMLLVPGFFLNGLSIVSYTVRGTGVSQPVRIALVTDLHSCSYGEGQKQLLDAIDGQNPDLVLLGGDIFDANLPDDNAAVFLRGIAGRYPCYYVTGNHEYMCEEDVFASRMAILEECGIIRLSGEAAEIELGGTQIDICGVDDPRAWLNEEDPEESEACFRKQLENLASENGNNSYTILLSHRPEQIGLYSLYGFDLVLSGHAHGGQWRIPRLVNGLYAPDQGLFPDYAGGQYKEEGTTMIVSRGLAKESTRIPRLYNPLELVIVELKP